MNPATQTELNICRAYIQHVKENFPTGSDLSDTFLFILTIGEWQVKRRLMNKPPTLDDLQTLKTGFRAGEKFLLEIDGGRNKKVIAEIESILQSIGLEFHAEIVEIEAQHPELKAEFAREREQYRLEWNHYITEA